MAMALTAGTASVTVTDSNGCSVADSVVLTEPTELVIDSLVSPDFLCGFNISCFGATDGSIAAYVTGGCPPYTYDWSVQGSTSHISGLGQGTYYVTITEAGGCVGVDSAVVTGTPLFSISGSSTDATRTAYGNAGHAIIGACRPQEGQSGRRQKG